MTWLRRYRFRHYLDNAIWVHPVLGMLAALLITRIIHWIDLRYLEPSTMSPETARVLLSTLAASMFTFIVFVSSALLVAVQLASAQLTPRIIALVFRSPVTRFSLTAFVVTFTLTLTTLVRIRDTVPQLSMYISTYSFVVCLAIFLILIDHVGKSLRPSGALRAVALRGRAVIKNVYPNRWTDSAGNEATSAIEADETPVLTVENPRDGVVLAFDVTSLVALAQESECTIELVPQVGDDVAVGEPLLRVFGKKLPPRESDLRQTVAIGFERTLEQDPTYAFRIMVDIASKGLSPAINDPTTAVQALDQIHNLLRYVGRRDLNTGTARDATGQLRVVYRTPDWEDFVRLAVTEIRHFGGESIQIARRLRAMLENLIQTLPESRTVLLQQELIMLHRSAERFFSEPEDRALAEISDAQGVGGKRSRK